jgi:hypothetical protein
VRVLERLGTRKEAHLIEAELVKGESVRADTGDRSRRPGPGVGRAAGSSPSDLGLD